MEAVLWIDDYWVPHKVGDVIMDQNGTVWHITDIEVEYSARTYGTFRYSDLSTPQVEMEVDDIRYIATLQYDPKGQNRPGKAAKLIAVEDDGYRKLDWDREIITPDTRENCKARTEEWEKGRHMRFLLGPEKISEMCLTYEGDETSYPCKRDTPHASPKATSALQRGGANRVALLMQP
jgi:hypothetical protein